MFDQYVNDEKAGQCGGWEVKIFQIFYFSKGLHKEKLEERERKRGIEPVQTQHHEMGHNC